MPPAVYETAAVQLKVFSAEQPEISGIELGWTGLFSLI